MDWWNLWDWRYDQDTLEESDYTQSGSQCDFYFGYRHDVIEERVLNEKSCIQVLRILITKADTEIDELEKNLVSLRTDLAFAEHKEWPELCCNALRDKIDGLDISLRSLRNKCGKDAEFQSSMDREPAETIHDLLKSLLSKFFQHKDKQTAGTNTMDPGQAYSRLSCFSDKEEESITGGSDGITRQQEAMEQGRTLMDKEVIENSSLKPEEKSSKTVDKTAEATAQASRSSSPESSTSCFGMRKSLSRTRNDMKANGNIEVIGKVKKPCYAATADYHPEENQAHDKTDEHSNAIIEYIGPDALIRSVALKEMDKPPGPNASASRAAITENFDMDQKLIDLKRTARKEGCKDSKVFMLNKFNASNPWSKTLVRGGDDLQIVANTQRMALTLQTQHGKNTIKVELDVEEPLVEESKKALIVRDKSHLNLGQQLQTARTERTLQSVSQSVVGPNCPATESKLNASSVSGWKRQKSDSDDDGANLKQLMGGKHMRKSPPLERHTKEHGPSLAIIQNSFSHPLESKRAANLAVSTHVKVSSVNLKDSDSHRHTTHGGSVDNDSCAGALVLLPCSCLKLKAAKVEDVKVNELKAIARTHKIKGFSNLKKAELLEFLKRGVGDQTCR